MVVCLQVGLGPKNIHTSTFSINMENSNILVSGKKIWNSSCMYRIFKIVNFMRKYVLSQEIMFLFN